MTQTIIPIGNQTYKCGTADCEVLIGDEKKSTFEPNVKFKKLNNKYNFSLEFVEKGVVLPQVGNKLNYNLLGKKIEYYPHGENRFEQNIILLTKPISNVLEFSLNRKGLTFHYQQYLTHEEKIQGGSLRPKEVEGSYAIFMDKSNFKYGSGKFGHIFNNYCVDALGRYVYPVMEIVGDLLQITIPQFFIDNAEYPIRNSAGLLIGWDTVGGTPQQWSHMIHASCFDAAAGTGTVFKIDCKPDITDQINMDCNIFLGGESLELLANGHGTPKVISGVDRRWEEFSFANTPVFEAIEYKLAGNSDVYTPDDKNWYYMTLYYDIVGGQVTQSSSGSYGNWVVDAWGDPNERRYAMYVDGVEAPEPPSFIPRVIDVSHIAKSMDSDFISKHDMKAISKASISNFISKTQKNFTSKTNKKDYLSKHNE